MNNGKSPSSLPLAHETSYFGSSILAARATASW
jgi:hypothetical protein